MSVTRWCGLGKNGRLVSYDAWPHSFYYVSAEAIWSRGAWGATYVSVEADEPDEALDIYLRHGRPPGPEYVAIWRNVDHKLSGEPPLMDYLGAVIDPKRVAALGGEGATS